MNLSEEIFKRYGFVKRARGNFLYTSKSKRLTDLYRAGGNAILGWGGTGGSITPFTMLKNFLNRGLTGFFKTPLAVQTEKALSELFASPRKVFFFYKKEDAFSFCSRSVRAEPYFFVPWKSENFSSGKEAVIMKLPFAWGTDIFAAALLSESAADDFIPDEKCVLLPPVLLAAVNRSVYDLIKASARAGNPTTMRIF